MIICCSIHGVGRLAERKFYRLPSLHVRGSTRDTKPSSIRPRSHQDPCIWSCLGSPQPLLNNITIICFCSSFLPQRSCWGVRRQTAGCAPLLCNQSKRENSQGLVETHAQIDKHTYGVPHTQWREKKVSIALPPPLQTFLEHLHLLNILAGVEKKLLCSAPVMFVHWRKQVWF